jgi:hypothetical protein
VAKIGWLNPPLRWSGNPTDVNSTLGFQEIFVINLPSRTDRRDMFELMAISTGINVKFVKGVTGDDVEEVAFIEVCTEIKAVERESRSYREWIENGVEPVISEAGEVI